MLNNFDFPKIFSIERIFEGSPGASFQFYFELSILFGLFLLLGIGLSVMLIFEKNKIKKKLFRRVRSLMFWTGNLGYLYLLLRSQNIYLFSSRFFLYTIFLLFFVRGGFILYYYFVKYSEELKKHERQEEIKKYIPKSKKKKGKDS